MDRQPCLIIVFFLLLTSIFFLPLQLTATSKRWNGSSSTDWNNMINWSPAGVPGEADEVILDNSILHTGYLLTLPDSTTRILSLVIAPANGLSIQLTLPATNKQVPALNLSSPLNALVLSSGAIFKNSSGLTSGQSIVIGGKMVNRNGGRYIHHTRASHATGIIAKLSTEAGTEKGEFEFDVPGGAYSLSLSNRTYGTLRLLGTASDGSQTYNATGSSISNIRGDLEIHAGVSCNLDLEKTLTIEGDFLQYGGVFNIASQPNNLQVVMKGEVFQQANATITESSTGLPVIAFEGTSQQQVSLAGSCLNSIGFIINNPWGLYLSSGLLIPYSLQFKSGKIQSSVQALLQIADKAIVTGASKQSFVDGPVLKIGEGAFEFPVGRQGDYAPLKMSGSGGSAMDRTIAQYHYGNPQQIYGTALESPSVLRISALEYWTIERNAAPSSGKLTLSVGPYSGATSLEKLVITNWDGDRKVWKDCGNSAYAGITSGTITSNTIALSGIYTVGTTVPDQNPLPVYLEAFTGIWSKEDVVLTWKAYNQQANDKYLIEFSENGLDFRQEDAIAAEPAVTNYVYRKTVKKGAKMYFRIVLLAGGVKSVQSQEISLQRTSATLRVTLYPVPAADVLHLSIVAGSREDIRAEIISISGRSFVAGRHHIGAGENILDLPVRQLPPGIYYLRIWRKEGTQIFPFWKL